MVHVCTTQSIDFLLHYEITVSLIGGKVALSRGGIMRVVWERQRLGMVDYIPLLSMSRALGDFWSYCHRTEQFAVSPVPDVTSHPLDLLTQKFVVVTSDGIWDVMTPTEVVEFVEDYRHMDQRVEVAEALINKALDKWERKKLPADNIAVLIAFLSREAATCSPPRHKHQAYKHRSGDVN